MYFGCAVLCLCNVVFVSEFRKNFKNSRRFFWFETMIFCPRGTFFWYLCALCVRVNAHFRFWVFSVRGALNMGAQPWVKNGALFWTTDWEKYQIFWNFGGTLLLKRWIQICLNLAAERSEDKLKPKKNIPNTRQTTRKHREYGKFNGGWVI